MISQKSVGSGTLLAGSGMKRSFMCLLPGKQPCPKELFYVSTVFSIDAEW